MDDPRRSPRPSVCQATFAYHMSGSWLPVGGAGLVQIALQVVCKCLARNGSGTEAVQVLGRHLAIDQNEPPLAQFFHQSGKADLGGVVGTTEHGLAEKQLAHGQAVKT